ncbi:peptide MFS transporter [Hydrocarboniphaga sp.]|uniref:peptide MFS transporter n=1 Tax=Hydrocarboniphaga sp. TaxID=2033016 RepID=UPI003D108F77
MTSTAATAHPRGLATLFFTEMWERFSYYGMRAILVLAMVAAVEDDNPGLGLGRDMATAAYGIYTTAVYLASLPGGWIADRLLGLRDAVFAGGCIIAAGHFTMAIPSNATFFVGLTLIALGTGLLKPNISAMVGELYPEGGARRDAGFSIFYMGINVGAFAGKLICGWLGEKHGWHYGFGAAGLFMVAGLVQYKLYGHHLGNIGLLPSSSGDARLDQRRRRRGWLIVVAALAAIAVIMTAALQGHLAIDPVRLSKQAAVIIVATAALYFGYVLLLGKLDALEKKRVCAIIVLFVGAAVFFAGFEQAGSSFNLFALDHTDRDFGSWQLPASWMQAVNPMFIILLSPFFAALWVNLARRNLTPSIPAKFALGLLQMAIGFLVMYYAARYVAAGEKVAPTWLVLTYLFHTTGELCLSPVGLAAVTKLAPRRYVGQMMGTWFMAASLGHIIAGLMAGHLADPSNVAALPDRFLLIFMVTAGAGALMLLISRPVQKLIGNVQ